MESLHRVTMQYLVAHKYLHEYCTVTTYTVMIQRLHAPAESITGTVHVDNVLYVH